MSRFTEVLVVSPLADGHTWYLRREFGYDVGSEGSGETIDVPVGFLTDFASIPRPLWWLLPRWGKYGNAAVIHDFCYWEQRYSRHRADRIFLEAMKVLGVKPITRSVMFAAVWLFGCFGWRKNRKLKKEGKNRIARKSPAKSVETRAELI